MNGPTCLAPAMPATSRVHSADRRRDTREQAPRRRDPPAPRQSARRAGDGAAGVGVGMMIADHPLHRSGRADLPHPAPASGDDAKSPQGIGMTDARRGQPAVDEPPHPVPGDVGLCWLRRDSARCQSQPTRKRNRLRAPGRSWAPRSSGCAHGRPTPATSPTSGMGSCMRRRSSAFTSLSFACNRFRIVCRSTVNRPFRVFPQMCVKPRKLKVSGFPLPRRAAGSRPRTARTRSGASSRGAAPGRTSRIARAARPGTARPPSRCWNPTTKSSANRTTITSPWACVFRHRWTQRSNT